MDTDETCRSCDGSQPGEGSTEVTIQVLGSLRVVVDSRPVEPWPRRPAQLVTLLALASGRRCSREATVGALWPRLSAQRGVANLHKVAHQVRNLTGADDAVVLEDGQVWLWPGEAVQVDLDDLEVEAARAISAHDRVRCATMVDRCAVGLAPACRDESWAGQARERLDRLHHELLLGAGRFHDLLAIDPTNEAAHRGLMHDDIQRRDPEAALARYRRLCHRLAALDLRPSPETVGLYHQAAAEIHDRSGPTRPPLIGCDELLRDARRQLCRATRGEGGTLLLYGPAEANTTRAALAITDEATSAGCTVLRTAAVTSPTATPYAPIATAITRLLATRPELAVPLSAGTRAELDRLTGHGSTDDRRPLRARAILELLEHAAGLGSSVVLLDDLQHVDPATAKLLGELGDQLRFSPVVLVLTLQGDTLPTHVEDLVQRLVAGGNCLDLAVPVPAAAAA